MSPRLPSDILIPELIFSDVVAWAIFRDVPTGKQIHLPRRSTAWASDIWASDIFSREG